MIIGHESHLLGINSPSLLAKVRMNIFIDTNILLDLYHLSGPDLDELKKIIKLHQTAQIKIYLPGQVKDEFYRNRERVVKESIELFEKSKALSNDGIYYVWRELYGRGSLGLLICRKKDLNN